MYKRQYRFCINQGVISVSGNDVNGISNLDISLKDLKCDGKIARQYVTNIQREGIKKQLKSCKVSNFWTQVLWKIKSEGNENSIFQVLKDIDARDFSIVSLGFNFSLEVNKVKIIKFYADNDCPPIFFDATGSISKKPKGYFIFFCD